jgi:hypothetical protein
MPDDDQFERYLRQFRPIAAEPLPVASRRPARLWLWSLAATAALALIIAAVLAISFRRKPAVPAASERSPAIQQLTIARPLTLSRANDLLAGAPSFEAAMDGLAFQSERIQVAPGRQSALEALGKEDMEP